MDAVAYIRYDSPSVPVSWKQLPLPVVPTDSAFTVVVAEEENRPLPATFTLNDVEEVATPRLFTSRDEVTVDDPTDTKPPPNVERLLPATVNVLFTDEEATETKPPYNVAKPDAARVDEADKEPSVTILVLMVVVAAALIAKKVTAIIDEVATI